MDGLLSTHTEFRIIGPPGTGKTTWLCRQVGLAVEKHGYDPADPWGRCPVLISSLTRGAAAEVAGRGLRLPDEAIGTLHSHALRALGMPKLCVDGAAVREWNEVCKPHHRLKPGGRRRGPDQDSEADESQFPGTVLLEAYHVYRARLKDRAVWRPDVACFAEEYETWKRTANYLDFDDLIHDAYADCEHAPGAPAVIFIDEAQDHDRAELRLIRKWAERAEKVIVVGDPDQNLYQWRGSDPEAFFEHEIPVENQRTLAQSYRVPRAVHAAAVRMIERCASRHPVEYAPRDHAGVCREADVGFSARMVDDLVDDAQQYLAAGKSVMFLATCEYQLRPLVAELRAAGVPFWNPFAKDRGMFNPLHPGRGTSTAARVVGFLIPSERFAGDAARLWTPDELLLWTEIVRDVGILNRGARKEIESAARDQRSPLTADQIRRWIHPDVIDELDEAGPEFLVKHALKGKAGPLEFAANIIRRHGVAGLKDQPRVVVGTIHSVKGGEADAVYLCPDLSPQGYDQLDSARPEPVYRQFYVGMTRARETLVLCQAETPRSIDW